MSDFKSGNRLYRSDSKIAKIQGATIETPLKFKDGSPMAVLRTDQKGIITSLGLSLTKGSGESALKLTINALGLVK